MFLHPSGWMIMIVFHSHEIRSSWGRFLLPWVFPWHLCTDLRIFGVHLCGGFMRASMGSTGWWTPFLMGHSMLTDPPIVPWFSGKDSLRLWRKSSWRNSFFLINDGRVTEKCHPSSNRNPSFETTHLGETSSPKTHPQSLQHTGPRGSVLDPYRFRDSENDRWKKLTERSKSTKKNVKFSVNHVESLGKLRFFL